MKRRTLPLLCEKIVERLPNDLHLPITTGEDIMNWTIKDLLVALKKELELREEIA